VEATHPLFSHALLHDFFLPGLLTHTAANKFSSTRL